MKQTRIGLVGLLMSFAAFKIPGAEAHSSVVTPDSTPPKIEEQNIQQNTEARLTKLTAMIREREQQQEADRLDTDELIAKGFLDGDDRGWRRSSRSGWADGRDGNFRNSQPWRNGWRDGHRFFDWPND